MTHTIRRLLAAALLAVGLISASAVFAADIVDGSGSTPLLVAASNDDVAQVKQLLKAGANPNVRNKLDTTPLLEAAFHSNSEIIQALLDAGADPNAPGADGQTPLMLLVGPTWPRRRCCSPRARIPRPGSRSASRLR